MRRPITPSLGALATVALLAAPAHAATESHFGIPDTIWKTLNLIVFFGLLVWLVGPPLRRFLESRRESIRFELDEARRKISESEAVAAEVSARLDGLEAEVEQIRRRAETEGEREAGRIAAQAEAERERFLARVEAEIERRGRAQRAELAREAAALTAEVAREIVEREITPADRQRVLDRQLRALDAVEGG